MLVSYPGDEDVEAWFAANRGRLASAKSDSLAEIAPWIPVIDLPGNDNSRFASATRMPIG